MMTRGLALRVAARAGWSCRARMPRADAVPVRADIQVRIDPETRELTGKGAWTVPPGESLAIVAGRSIRRAAPARSTGGPASGYATRRAPAVAPGAERRSDATRRDRVARPARSTRSRPRSPASAAPRRAGDRLHAVRSCRRAAQWHPVFVGRPLQYTLRVDVPTVAARHRRRGSASDRNTMADACRPTGSSSPTRRST